MNVRATKTLLSVLATAAAVWLSGTTLLAQRSGFLAGPQVGAGRELRPCPIPAAHDGAGSGKTLSVTNDDEWGVIQPLIQKVMDGRRHAENFMGGRHGHDDGTPAVRRRRWSRRTSS